MGVELGIGESLIIKAIAQSTGRSVPQIKAEMKTVGDLGEVAQVSRPIMSRAFRCQYLPLCRQAIERKAENSVQSSRFDRAFCLQVLDRYRKGFRKCCTLTQVVAGLMC